jgi:hypothetical protein
MKNLLLSFCETISKHNLNHKVMKKVFTLLLTIFLFAFTYASPPTISASNLKFSSLDGARFALSFTGGNGATRIVVMKEGSPVTGVPVNGVEYAANSKFGTAGTEFTQPGEYVVFKSGWTSFTAENLKPNTIYYVSVFEYNGTNTTTDYLLIPLTGNQATVAAPTTQASNPVFSNIIGNTVKLSWTNGNGGARIILMRKGAPVNAVPEDLKSYTPADMYYYAGDRINGDNIVVYKGTANNAVVNRMDPNTTYYFSIFEYNGSSNPMYLAPGVTGSVLTNAGPTVGPSYVNFDNHVGGDRLTVGFGIGNGNGRIVIGKKGSPVTAVPVNGQSYTASTVFGNGTEIAPGEFVVSNSNASGVTLSNLELSTRYYFRVYEFDSTSTGYRYFLTSAYKDGNETTAVPPSTLSSNFKINSLNGNSISVSYTPGNGAYRLIVAKEGSAVDAVPVNLTMYNGNPSFGAGTQLSPGNYSIYGLTNSNSFSINALKPGSTYFVSVFDYNGGTYPIYNPVGATMSFYVPAEPTAASTSLAQLSREGNAMRLRWTSGNGSRRMVIAKKGSAVTFKPVDGTVYTADGHFGSGTETAAGEFVIYDGTSDYFDLYSLEIGSNYYFAVFEYNVGNAGPDYLTSSYLSGNAATYSSPTVQTSALTASNIQATQATISFIKGDGTDRLFLLRAGSPVTAEPQDLVVYNANTSYGGSQLGSGNYIINKTSYPYPFTVTNLSPNTTYYVSAFEYNGSSGAVYMRPGSSFSFTTTDIPGATTPTNGASNPIFSSVDGNKLTLSWSNGNGTSRIVVARKNSAVDFVPASATSYTANAAFASGTDLGNGQYVVFNGSGTAVSISNLQPSSTYHFAVYEYNGTGTTLRYLTSSVLTCSTSTATAPVTGSTNAIASVNGGNLTLSWSNGSGAGRLVVMKAETAITAAPVDLNVYPANTGFGSGSQLALGEFVVYSGSANTVTVTGLSANKTYYYKVFEYNGSAAPVYNTSAVLSGSAAIESTLPVQWLYFTATEKEGSVLLKWGTAQENNAAYFSVEKSSNGIRFLPLENVAAKNSTTEAEYTYTDREAATGVVYYRLKQVDKDGKSEYSRVVSLKLNEGKKLSLVIYPNPATNTIQINASVSSSALVRIYNQSGTMIHEQKLGGQPVNVTFLKPGAYYLVVKDGTNQYNGKFIKQ